MALLANEFFIAAWIFQYQVTLTETRVENIDGVQENIEWQSKLLADPRTRVLRKELQKGMGQARDDEMQ